MVKRKIKWDGLVLSEECPKYRDKLIGSKWCRECKHNLGMLVREETRSRFVKCDFEDTAEQTRMF